MRLKEEVIRVNTEEKSITIKRNDHTSYEESFDDLIISTGATAIVPPLEGVELDNVFILKTIPHANNIKKYVEKLQKEKNIPIQAVIVGGGFIGLEVAENLKRLGADVHVVEFSTQVMPPFDYEMALLVKQHMEENGIIFHLGQGLNKVVYEKDGTYAYAGENLKLKADIVILAIGVRPDTDFLKDSEIKLTERGAIIVDEYLETNIKDIYAVGDAIITKNIITHEPMYLALAGPANRQGRMVASNIMGLKKKFAGVQGTSAVTFFDKMAVSTGLSEKELKKLQMPYDKVYIRGFDHTRFIPDSEPMFIKVLFHTENGKVLGGQIVGGKGADKRIDVLATAIKGNLTVYDLAELELAYAPAINSARDPLNTAGFVAENVLDSLRTQIHWDEIKDVLDPTNKNQILDIRKSPVENEEFSTLQIPFDTLQDTLYQLNKDAPVYLLFFDGQDNEKAIPLLEEHGFTVYDINQAYQMYKSII